MESSIHLPESRIPRSKFRSAMQAYRPYSQRRHDGAAHSESHRIAGLLQCHRLIAREGNAQASALQDHHLWLMVLVFQQEVDSCRSCASCGCSPNHPTAERRPRRTSALNTLLSSVDVVTYCVQLSHVHCPVVGPSRQRSKCKG
jgi:hypothetical protein